MTGDARRSEAQNRKWRAVLTDISRCKPEGRCLTPPQWQVLLYAGWDHDRRFGDLQLMEGLEGRPPVPVNGYSTSILTVADMADLITFAFEYGDRHGVKWSGGDWSAEDDPLVAARDALGADEFRRRLEHVAEGKPIRPRLPLSRDPLMREAGRG